MVCWVIFKNPPSHCQEWYGMTWNDLCPHPAGMTGMGLEWLDWTKNDGMRRGHSSFPSCHSRSSPVIPVPVENVGPRWMALKLGVERNRKQRNPVNSITSWIVSGTLLCTGSTGPFIAIGSLKDFFSSCKEEKFPRQDIRYYLKYVCKEEGRNTGVTRIFCRHVMI